MKKISKKALRVLLKYAYPCIEHKYGNIFLVKRIYKIIKENKEIDEDICEILEKIIPVAVREINRIAKEKEEIDEEIVRYYFLKEHEKIIGDDKPEEFRELCLVKEGEVVKIVGDKYLVRFSDGSERIVKSLEEISVGDRVYVHYYYICEKA